MSGLSIAEFYGSVRRCAVMAESFGSKQARTVEGTMTQPLADITSHDTYLDGVPHDTFAYLREHDPVHWTEESDGGRGFWSVTRHEDVLQVSRNPEIFSSRTGHPARGHGRRGDRGPAHPHGDGRARAHPSASPREPALRPALDRRVRGRRTRPGRPGARRPARLAHIRLRASGGPRTAHAHARAPARAPRRGPGVAGPARRRADRQHRPGVHRLRRRPGRHLRLSSPALPQSRGPGALRVRRPGRSRSGASRRPTTS